MPDPKSFHVPTPIYLMMRANRALAPLLIALSRLESWAHPPRGVDRPVFVCGIARAGTTITLEMLARHPDAATHRYSDFVLPYLPIWWASTLPRLPIRGLEDPVERIHRDRIQVTRHSPEAIEEMLWMRFFPGLHRRGRSHILDASTSNPKFERYYAEHIGKLLRQRGSRRYLAKNNYLVARLGYLLRIFPDARILLLIRHPASHVASLAKQHRIFHEIAAVEPRQHLLIHVAGHFEFGPARVCSSLGDQWRVDEIERCWRDGQEVRGWALQWAMIYEHLADQLERDFRIAAACLPVRYEELCDRPRQAIAELLVHTDLDAGAFEPIADEYAAKLSRPGYYQPDFTAAELADIRAITKPTAARFGY